MIKFDEQKQLDSVAGALAIRKEIEGIAADVAGRGYKNICYLGIGGTYASALQTQNHVQEYSGMEIIAQNAALYNTTGNRRIGKDTVIVLSSVTGTTQEVVEAVEKGRARWSSALWTPPIPRWRSSATTPSAIPRTSS